MVGWSGKAGNETLSRITSAGIGKVGADDLRTFCLQYDVFRPGLKRDENQ